MNLAIDEAKAFAPWAEKHLPTINEWERAALGNDGRTIFPWGNQRHPARANVKDNPTSKSSLVKADSFSPEGDSPDGVRQMVGNVWEFIDEIRPPSPQALEIFRDVMSPSAPLNETW